MQGKNRRGEDGEERSCFVNQPASGVTAKIILLGRGERKVIN